jgi:hypothetical protein
MASPQENRHSRMHVHARSVSFPVMPIASAARVLHGTTPRRVDQQRERHVTTDDCKGIRDHDLRGWHGAGPGGMCDQSGRGGIGDDGCHAGTATELSEQLPRDSQSLHGVRAQQQRPHRQGLGTRRVPSVRRLVGRPRELGRLVRGRCLELQRQYRLSSALLTLETATFVRSRSGCGRSHAEWQQLRCGNDGTRCSHRRHDVDEWRFGKLHEE